MPNSLSTFSARLRAHRHFLLILIAFLTFRLLMPFAFRAGSFFTENVPDLGAYTNWGTLADSHLYPFVNYWSEYPPLFAWSMIGLYRLSTLLPAWPDQRLWFSIVMQLAFALFDAGSLILMYKIALLSNRKIRAIRIAALFAGGFAFAFAAAGWYEPVPLFFLLLTLYFALSNRFRRGALTAAIGLMTKLIPILIVPIALQHIKRLRDRASYLITIAVVSLGIVLPFLIVGRDYLLAFVRATFNRASWLSIWALIDGNYSYGKAPPIIDRFSAANIGPASISSVPWSIVHLAFAALFIFLYTRRIDWHDPLKSIAFTGLTINLFFLWSKGFSGQFTVYIIPFILLIMPNRRGIGYVALLSLLWIAEWPIGFLFLKGFTLPIVWVIIARTAVLIALSLEYLSHLFQAVAVRLSQAAMIITGVVWLSVLPVGVVDLNAYAQLQTAQDPIAPAIDLIRSQSGATTPNIVFSDAQTFRRVYAFAQTAGGVWGLPDPKLVPEDARLAWLDSLTSAGPAWFVVDASDPAAQDTNDANERWLSDHACKVDTVLVGSARVSRFVGLGSTPISINASAVFSNELQLLSARLSDQVLRAGDSLCVELNWQTLRTPLKSYAVVVRIRNQQDAIIAQNDMRPQGGFGATKQWEPGTTILDKHGLILPNNLVDGDYTLEIALHLVSDGEVVRVTQADNELPNSGGIILTRMATAP